MNRKRRSSLKEYRHKLNLLGPGQVMMKLCLILLGLGTVCCLLNLEKIGFWLFGAAAMILLVLLILVGIEQHQDQVCYEQAKGRDPEIK